jgi:uncharacterized repeat protein (TIGR01451 family)
LVKAASETTAHGADVITYTLTYSNKGGSTIFNAAVTDILPGAMTYVAGSASNGGLYSGGQISWSIPSLAPGASLQLTYKAQVGLQVNTGEVLVNNACLSYAGTTNCVSNSVTLLGNYVVKITIFNSAGELVKTLNTYELASAISNFSVVDNVIQTDQDTVKILYQGMTLDAWDGTNIYGNKVSNGTYFIEVNSTDPFGVTTTVTQQATVLLGSNLMQFMVFNEAGETVMTLSKQQIESLIGGPLQAADYDLGKVTFSTTVITPSYGNPTGKDSSVLVTLGSGRSFRWEGVNDGGKILTSGQYILTFKSQISGKAEQNVSEQVTVLNANSSPIEKVVVKPNPVYLNQTQKVVFAVTVNAPQANNVQVKIYTLAGELVGHALMNDTGNLGQVSWDLSGVNIASGMYFADIELREGNQVLDRKIVKLAILH